MQTVKGINMLSANDFKKRNNDTPTLYAILPPLPLEEDLVSPVAITSYQDIRFAIMDSQIPCIENAKVAIVQPQTEVYLKNEDGEETSYNVRVIRYLWFQEVMGILTTIGLGPNPTLLIKNLRQIFGRAFEDYYKSCHLSNFYIMSEEKLEPGNWYKMRVNAYETPYELIHNLPEEEPKEYHFYEIREVSTEESIRIENSFRLKRPKHYTTKSFEVVKNDDIFDTELYNYHRTAPEWFQRYHMTLRNGKYALIYINDIGYIPIEISAMAVKALNIPATIYQEEDGDIIYNDTIVYKIITNDIDEIRGVILENKTLYDTKDLVRRVVDILCNDKCKRIERTASKIKKNGYRFTEEALKFDPWMR